MLKSSGLPAAVFILLITLTSCSPSISTTQEPVQASATPIQYTPTDTASIPSDPCDLSQGWNLTFSYTGGIAGLDRALTLNADGSATAVDRRAKNESNGEITEAELKQIVTSLEAVCPQNSTARPKLCPDCFTYLLTLSTSQGRSIDLRVSDGDELEPEMLSLLSQLRQLTGKLLE
jgi:hypothetical protein